MVAIRTVDLQKTLFTSFEFANACGKCQRHVETAEGAAKPIEKGLAAVGMLAYIATSKFADHLPIHRLEGNFKRQGSPSVILFSSYGAH